MPKLLLPNLSDIDVKPVPIIEQMKRDVDILYAAPCKREPIVTRAENIFSFTRTKILSRDWLATYTYIHLYIYIYTLVSSVKYNFIDSHSANIYIRFNIFQMFQRKFNNVSRLTDIDSYLGLNFPIDTTLRNFGQL